MSVKLLLNLYMMVGGGGYCNYPKWSDHIINAMYGNGIKKIRCRVVQTLLGRKKCHDHTKYMLDVDGGRVGK